jgi:folate-binding protein YgfZ
MEIFADLAAYHRYSPSTVLKIAGEDAFPFLQGQFTQDLKPCVEAGFIAYGLWLNQKGKVLADSYVLKHDGAWLCISLFSAAETIRQRLETYVIADDVMIEDVTAQWASVAFVGVGAADLVTASTGISLADGNKVNLVRHGFVFPGRRSTERSWEWLYPMGDDEALAALRALRSNEVGPEIIERLRITAGIPSVPRDIGPEDLPNEGGLDRDAISYTKGCYLGQEVMARLKTMGQVRRRLMRVAGPVEPPAVLPVPLFVDGKKMGELRSAVRSEAGFVGFAMISLLAVTGRGLLSFSPDSAANIVISDAPA